MQSFSSLSLVTTSDKIARVIDLTSTLITTIPNYSSLEDLAFKCAEFLEILKIDVVYEGEEEAKQKQYGRALFDRRKRFFKIIKASSESGFTSRRGQSLNSEQLVEDSLSFKHLTHYPCADKVGIVFHALDS
jgi:hypothetical protein